MRNAARLAVLSAFVAMAACGGDSTGPSDHSPRSIAFISGSNQQGVVGTVVGTAPSVVVKDKSGSVVSGAVVTFAVTAGGGGITGGVVTTDAAGIAQVGSWTLGTATGTNTLSASVASLTPVSLSATAVAGPAANLSFSTAPSTTAANGVALAQQPVIQLKDQFGNNATQAGVTVVAAIAAGGGTLGGVTTAPSNASGVVTFTNLSIAGSIGARTLSFSATGLPVLNSGSIALTAGPAASVSANSLLSLTGTAGAAVAPLPSVIARDASNNVVAGASVTFAVATGGGAVTGATQLTDAAGIATVGSWTLGGAVGAQTLTATMAALPVVTFTATAGPAAGSRLTLATQPSATAVNGVQLAQQPVLRIEDAFGNLVTTASNTVTVALQGAGAGLGGTTSLAAVNGIVTFTNLAITGSVGSYTLAFSGAGLTGATSSAIALGAGAAATISVSAGDNQNAPVGTAVPIAPSVRVSDGSGNPVSGISVTFAVATGGGSVVGGSASSNASGIATVGSWTLGNGIGSNTLTATSASLAGSPVTFTATGTPGAGSLLTITTQPSASANNGVVLAQQPVIQLRDQLNNPVSLPGVVVTAAVASGGGSVSGGTTATTDVNGTASFSGLILNGLIGTKTLSFSALGVTPVASGNIALAAGAAAKLAIVTSVGSSVVNGALFSPQPSVRLQDAGGNNVSQAGVLVTASLSGGPGAVLGGTLNISTGAAGAVTYSTLRLTGLVGSYSLAFNSAGLTGVTMGPVSLLTGPAATLALDAGDGQTAPAGTAVPVAPSVLVTDQSGNPVNGQAVSFAVATGGGSVSGGAATSNASGIASVTSWTLGAAVGSNTLTATAGVLPAVTFSASGIPGAASQLVFTTAPSSSANNGIPLAQQPVLQLQDQFGNDVSQSGVVVTAAVASGGGSVSGGTTATTSASGSASFNGLILNGLVGTKTLSFSAPGVTAATSGNISLAAGAPAQVIMVTQPSASAVNGAVFATQPVVRITDAGGNFVLQTGTAVTVAIASGGGALGGTATVNTDPSGIATFSGLGITGLAGNRTLSFSASGLASATSITIAITAGAATTIAISAGDGQTAAAGSAVATGPSVLVTDQSGNPVSGTSVSFAVATGGGSVVGGAATSNASGIAAVTSWTLGTTAGSNTLTATSAGLAGSPLTFTATATAAAASQLVLATAPSSSASNGIALAQQPVLQLQDQFGNDVSQSGVVVTAAVASGGGSVSGGTTATTSAGGTATFSGLILNGLVGVKTLSFSAPGITAAVSGNISLAAGAPAQVIMVTQPSASAVNGAVFATQPVVRITDAGGNFVLQAGTGVTVAIATGGGSLGGTATVNTDPSGIATFSGLSITGVAGNHTLSFSSAGLASATSNTIAITAGPATSIGLNAGDAQTATVGTAVTVAPSVLVTDQSGNPVSGTSVSFAVATGAGAVLGGAATSNASGIAAVTSWTLGSTVGSNTLTATSGGLVGSPVTFTATGVAGAASQLSITTQPSANASNGVAIAQQPVLQLQDQFGNAASQAGVILTAAIATGGGSVSGGTTATTNASGVASFSGLIVNGLVGVKTLSFSAPGITSAVSGNISLAAGAASQIAITTQPSATVANGATLATQPVLQLKDAGGNDVASSGVAIVASLTGSPAGVALGGTTTATTSAGGVAGFTNLSLTGLVGSYTLTFTRSGLTSAASGAISLVAGAPVNVTANSVTSQAGRVGIAATTLPQVKVVDASGNPVSGATVTFAVSAGGGSVTGATPTTNALGLATVGGWILGKTVATNTVTATVGALPVVSFNASPTFVVSRVAGGGGFTCAITIDGVPYCWGDNSTGALGDNSTSPHFTPAAVAGSSSFVTISAGLGHTCGVTSAGAASCWGSNASGQLGINSTTQQLIPAAVSGGLVFSTVDLGSDHTCGVTTGGAVDCWGANGSGQLGLGNFTQKLIPTQVAASGYSQVTSGVFYSCGTRTTGVGNCWGINGFGQLGDSTKVTRTLPTIVKGGLIFVEVVSSQAHSCGRTSAGTVFCWGLNANGRLAQDTLTLPNNESLVPKQVAGLSSVVQLVAGQAHTCARINTGLVSCWGLGDAGQLGNGDFNNRQAPTPVTLPGGVTGFTTISAGASHSCGVTSSGSLYCWGDNFSGQLGNGGGSDQNLPVLVLNP